MSAVKRGVEREIDELQSQDALGYGLIAFAFLVVFPRLAYWTRWPTRLGPRGTVAYIAFNTMVGFALRTWALPFLKRMAYEREQAENEVRRQLGRDPTDDELLEHLGLTCRR